MPVRSSPPIVSLSTIMWIWRIHSGEQPTDRTAHGLKPCHKRRRELGLLGHATRLKGTYERRRTCKPNITWETWIAMWR